MKRLLFALLFTASPLMSHPHIFIDVGLELRADAEGRLEAVKITWAYDALYSLLVTEDYGMDPDGDGVLTEAEERQLTGFDMNWDPGFEGDLVAYVNGQKLELSRPVAPTAVMREGRIVTTHLREPSAAPLLHGAALSLKPFDPTYYTAYDVTMKVEVKGLDGCMIGKEEPDMDAELSKLQDQLARLDAEQDAIELGFPEVGEAMATEVRISCPGS
jgi:ABC-type uncharacterized transport system substrate-binding protein